MRPLLLSLLRMAAAYMCACFVAVLVIDLGTQGKIVETWFPVAAAALGFLALPGFAVLRAALWWGRVRSIAGFALAGAANASVAIFLFDRTIAVQPVLNGAGLAAGAMYHVVVKAICGQIAVRNAMGVRG